MVPSDIIQAMSCGMRITIEGGLLVFVCVFFRWTMLMFASSDNTVKEKNLLLIITERHFDIAQNEGCPALQLN